MTERAKLQKRLDEVRNPDYLIQLKKHLKDTESEIARQKKMRKDLHNDQAKRENRLNHLAEKNDQPEAMKQINDKTSRLAYLNEKLTELQDEKMRTEEIKMQQVK